MTATEKRSTARGSGTSLQGVLFLTAGYGTRAEPLSFARPKSLLPWKDTTVLGALVRQFAVLRPEVMAFNASRCPEMILDEVQRNWSGRISALFEERPLGTAGTLARNSGMFKGTWMVCNTDFVMEVPVEDLLSAHLSRGRGWTALTCAMPEAGEYGTLEVQGRRRHYAGVCAISQEVALAASGEQITGGLFTELRQACSKRGVLLREHYCSDEWMDMGETELFRRNTLKAGSFVHPYSEVHQGAVLEGFYSVGPYCIISDGARIRDSVLLEGSAVPSGGAAVEEVLPWFYRRSEL